MFPGVLQSNNIRDSGTLRVGAQRYLRARGGVAGDAWPVIRGKGRDRQPGLAVPPPRCDGKCAQVDGEIGVVGVPV